MDPKVEKMEVKPNHEKKMLEPECLKKKTKLAGGL